MLPGLRVPSLGMDCLRSRRGGGHLEVAFAGTFAGAYFARWRMLLAARVLRDDGLSIREAANRIGYELDVPSAGPLSGNSVSRRAHTASAWLNYKAVCPSWSSVFFPPSAKLFWASIVLRDRGRPVGPSTERYQKHRRALFGILDTENR